LSIKHSCCLLVFTSIAAFANTITITGPERFTGSTPNDALLSANYKACTPGPGCIDGDPLIYNVFSLSITSPTSPGGLWTIDLETNYGATIPSGSHTIPSYAYSGSPGTTFAIGDIMFEQGGLFYGIALSPHDGYTVGDFYQVSGFQTSAQVLVAGGVPAPVPGPGGAAIPRPYLPTEINAGGLATQMTGTLTVTPNAGSNGTNFAEYKIIDTFSAPSTFLNTAFSVFATSYACANGYLEGGGGGFTGGAGGGATPEPGSWLLILPGLVLVGIARYRKSRA